MIRRIINGLRRRLKPIAIDANPCYKSIFGFSPKFWRGFPFNLEVVNLGSNTGLYGFRYDGLPVKAENWALGPQSLNQDLMILKTYSSYIGPRGAILAPLCPYSSCAKNYKGTELLKYYTIVHPGVIEDFSLEQQKLAYEWKDHPFRQACRPMLRGFMQAIKCRIKGAKELIELDYQPLDAKSLERNAQGFIDGWMQQFKIDDMDAPLPKHILEGRKKRVETVKEMIKFCRDRDFRLYFVLPPITPALSKMMSPVFRENYIYSFARECGVTSDMMLDYLDDENLNDAALFVNSLFLNMRGAQLFTKRVLEDIGIKF